MSTVSFLTVSIGMFFLLFITLAVYSFVYPSLKTLGEDLVTVLDFLHVKYVIGLGEGAGANVLARFGLAHPARCLGLILINCTGSAASVVDSFKTKVISSITFNISLFLRKNYLCPFLGAKIVHQLEGRRSRKQS